MLIHQEKNFRNTYPHRMYVTIWWLALCHLQCCYTWITDLYMNLLTSCMNIFPQFQYPILNFFCFLIFCICTILHVNMVYTEYWDLHSSLLHSSATITNLLSKIYNNPPIRLRSNLRLYFIQRSLPKLQMSATQS